MTFIGIDPGKSGGIAAVSDDGQSTVAYKMPETEKDIWILLSSIKAEGPCFCLIERVHSMPGQGVSSVFTFGMGYGALRMALVGLSIPFETVNPQAWQKGLGCLTKGDKNVSKARAQQLFPQIKVNHYVADALLIAEFCRRSHGK